MLLVTRHLASLLPLVAARDIVFPAAYDYQSPLKNDVLSYADTKIDLSDSKFGGLTTFANLPYVHCLAKDEDTVEPFDIAILGAPFDTGVTARPGARYGPLGIRLGSRRVHPNFDWNIYTGRNVFREWAKVVECGDAPLTFLDNTYALKQLDQAHEIISGRKTNDTRYAHPRIVTLGGDHTTTLPALRSTYKRWGKVSVIHFDSHIDTWDSSVLGGGISHYAGVNHGTFLHIAAEEGLIHNTSIHGGIRAPVSNPKYDLDHDKACGFAIVTARDIDRIGVAGVIRKIKQRVGDTKVYISVDIDVLDPAVGGATGTAEPGGWTSRELLSILDGLDGLKVVGADLVEVSPIYDNPSETTGLAAAEVVLSLLRLMIGTPVES